MSTNAVGDQASTGRYGGQRLCPRSARGEIGEHGELAFTTWVCSGDFSNSHRLFERKLVSMEIPDSSHRGSGIPCGPRPVPPVPRPDAANSVTKAGEGCWTSGHDTAQHSHLRSAPRRGQASPRSAGRQRTDGQAAIPAGTEDSDRRKGVYRASGSLLRIDAQRWRKAVPRRSCLPECLPRWSIAHLRFASGP